MRIQQFDKLDNVHRLSKIIFLNFIFLMEEQDIRFSVNDIQRLFISRNIVGWFLLNDNENIVGYLIGEIKHLDDGRLVYFICYFYIINEYRSKGFGKILLLKCLKQEVILQIL